MIMDMPKMGKYCTLYVDHFFVSYTNTLDFDNNPMHYSGFAQWDVFIGQVWPELLRWRIWE